MTDSYECKLVSGDIVAVKSFNGQYNFYLILDGLYEKTGSHYNVVDLGTEKKTEAFVGSFDTKAKVIANFNEGAVQKCMTSSGLDGPAVVEEIKGRVDW